MSSAGSTPSKGGQTRHVILEAAIARFGQDGYRDTSVAHIARAAGVGGTVAYAYFPNKEALFFAAVDEDAAAVITEAMASDFGDAPFSEWWQSLLLDILASLERHPLARRLLAGLEPEVTVRLVDIPALEELRTLTAERMRSEQIAGGVRLDIDPATMASAVVAVMLSLVMSAVQLGTDIVSAVGVEITALFAAAIERAPMYSPPGGEPAR